MTYEEVLDRSRALLNDQSNVVFTNSVQLPYLNMALGELQEIFELNNVPVTNETSATITVPAGITSIGFASSPALPSDLIEIQQIFESPGSANVWTPLVRMEFLPPLQIPIANFVYFSWINQEIRLLEASGPIDLRLDYIKSLFPEIEIGDVDNPLNILNAQSFLQYRTAALSASFIGENPERSGELNTFAEMSLDRVLGINVKGKQAIFTRRRPFRASYKTRGRLL